MVVFAEGKNSEPDYVNGLKNLPHISENTALKLEVHPEQGTPLTLVEMAVARQQDSEIDECWCLFDVEWPKHHPNLEKAIALAAASNIKLAISNPCFEVWLILHLKAHTRFVDTKDAERTSKGLDGRTGKSIDAAKYLPHRKEAALRARALARRHSDAGTRFPHDNPSSGMYRFLEAVEGNSSQP